MGQRAFDWQLIELYIVSANIFCFITAYIRPGQEGSALVSRIILRRFCERQRKERKEKGGKK